MASRSLRHGTLCARIPGSTTCCGAPEWRRRIRSRRRSPSAKAEVDALKAVSRSAKLLTITGSAALVERGLSLGIVLSGDKNTILINQQASAEEGVSFGSDLLRLAKMVK